jgi:DNA-directed RNA polymerase II subunit RPB2
VVTKAAKWLHTQDIPAGENCVVAIMCYTGFNQEDSKLVNKSAVDRGLLRATALKKEDESIEKNPTTSQDDIFMRLFTRIGVFEELGSLRQSNPSASRYFS